MLECWHWVLRPVVLLVAGPAPALCLRVGARHVRHSSPAADGHFEGGNRKVHHVVYASSVTEVVLVCVRGLVSPRHYHIFPFSSFLYAATLSSPHGISLPPTSRHGRGRAVSQAGVVACLPEEEEEKEARA